MDGLDELNRSWPMGMPVVRATRDSLEWILRKGAFVVPHDNQHLRLLTLFKMWGKYKKEADLENGQGDYWQIIDLRKTHSWQKRSNQ
jgi:hypothetical protein